MEVANNLSESAMKGNWDDVVTVYKENQDVHGAQISRSGGTALHIAVSAGETDVVSKLVKIIVSSGDHAYEVLSIKNYRGDTALHLAATIGDAAMCHCMAMENPKLITVQNSENETPLFLSVLHGKKKAYMCLNSHCPKQGGGQIDYSFFRRGNGDTILHSAVSGEFYTIIVIKLKKENQDHDVEVHQHDSEKQQIYRDETFMSYFRKMLCVFSDKMLCFGNKSSKDVENPSENNSDTAPIYATTVLCFKLMICNFLIVLDSDFGEGRKKKIKEWKKRHTWATQVMNELVERSTLYKYEGKDPLCWQKESLEPDRLLSDCSEEKSSFSTASQDHANDTYPKAKSSHASTDSQFGDKVIDKLNISFQDNGLTNEEKKIRELKKKETPILIAAKMGVTEIVEKILDIFPMAIQDLDSEKKNALLLAAEHRQADIFNLLLQRKTITETIFRQLDKQGNSALHLAAKFEDSQRWYFPGSALQMQWEHKWYKFVKKRTPKLCYVKYNGLGQTPKDIFTSTHKDLVTKGGEWLTKTSQSCSVLAALIATVAFGASTTVPGGVRQETGVPTLGGEFAFDVFAISSLVALSFSVTALVFFLAILASRCQEDEFAMDLPRKLLFGLSSLLVSIASMLVTFCSAHLLVIKDKLRYAIYPLYTITLLPVTFYALMQLPFYINITRTILSAVPKRTYKH